MERLKGGAFSITTLVLIILMKWGYERNGRVYLKVISATKLFFAIK